MRNQKQQANSLFPTVFFIFFSKLLKFKQFKFPTQFRPTQKTERRSGDLLPRPSCGIFRVCHEREDQQDPQPLKNCNFFDVSRVPKSCFFIFFLKLDLCVKNCRICSSFGVNTYRWPSSRAAAQEMNESLKVQVEDQERLLKAHEHFVKSEAASLLEPVDRNRDSLIEEWRPQFEKKKDDGWVTMGLLCANSWSFSKN